MRCFNLNNHYKFEDFKEIIARLRGKDGCPWDKAQTLESLKPCLINETAEVLAGINMYAHTQEADNLCEELGDLLLQVVLQSQIAQEEGLFSLEDVIQGISQKMIRRHPHVFGTGYVDSAGEVIRRWDEIKRIEKSKKTKEELQLLEEEVKKAEQEMINHLKNLQKQETS